MDLWMLRTFDQAGFYETRLILMIICLAIAGYFFYSRKDRRYLIMFLSGAFLQMIAEYLLQYGKFRGWSYNLSVLGFQLPGVIRPLYQGLTEGGPIAVFAFWFADLRASKAGIKAWLPFGALSLIVVLLAFIAGSIGSGERITSQRPMFVTHSILAVTAIIFASLWIAWRKNAVSSLTNFFAGLLVFAFLNYEPLHLMGVRFIGAQINGQFTRASTFPQIVMMFLSNIFEASGGKLHYFILPFLLGLVALKEAETRGKRERYSTQHLQDLTDRGWRKRSKPF